MPFARTLSLALLGSAVALSAHASAAKSPTETVLNFPLLHLPLPLPLFPGSDLTYKDTVGGKLTVSAPGGELAFSLLGYLGVSSGNLLEKLDLSLGKNEVISFKFDKPVQLSGWDIDDFNPTLVLKDGTDQFSVGIDGKAAKVFDFKSHAPASPLVGSSFTFGYAGDSYLIDQLRFTPVAVPEAGTLAQLGLGLALTGVAVSRRRKAG